MSEHDSVVSDVSGACDTSGVSGVSGNARAAVATLMRPASVAVIGASEDQNKYGGRLMRMLLSHGFSGHLMPVNPARDALFGVPAFASIAATPEAPDVAIMAIPQPKVRETIEACVARGVKAAIVITARFSDAGEAGAALEKEIVGIARAGGMRLVGPNCLGIISPAHRVVLCPSTALAIEGLPVGRVGFVSQSGALMGTVFDRARLTGLGFSHAVSVGNQADLELCDFVEYLIDDPATGAICTYIEGLKMPRRFAALAARARKAGKPLLAVSSGRTRAGAQAAFSHTASVAGDRAVFEAVCREEHVTLLDSPIAMVELAASLADHPRTAVRRIAVFSPSGGEAALAADAIETAGLQMATFSDATRARLANWFAASQSANPVDTGGRTVEGPDVIGEAASVVADDPDVDALLFAMTTSPTLKQMPADVIDALSQGDARNIPRKPVLFAFETGQLADVARQSLVERGRWYTNHLGEAIDVLAAWRRRSGFLVQDADIAATRPPGCETGKPALSAGEYNEHDTREWLRRYGIRTNDVHLAQSEDDAVRRATELGFPAVLKIVSPDIVHKSDVGGVRVDLYDADRVRDAYRRMIDGVRQHVPDARIDGVSVQTQMKGPLEMIVGARRDASFGPVVVFGAGGVLVDLLGARAIARAPVSPARVEALLRDLPIWPLFAGHRGVRVNLDSVIDTIVRVSWLAADLSDGNGDGESCDFELDLNPVIVNADGCCAVDARLKISGHAR